jgi:hypothetical protein
MKAESVPATAEHVEELIANLRAEDRAEVCAFRRGVEPIRESFQLAHASHALLVDGRVLAVWGVLELDGGAAAIWMHGSADLPRHGRLVLRFSRAIIEKLAAHYRRLEVLVSANYRQACRWLEWLGFSLGRVGGTADNPVYLASRGE